LYTDVELSFTREVMTYNFPVTITQPYNDVSVNIVPGNSAIPGFINSNYILYTNEGTELINSGTISYTSSPNFEITNISTPGAVINPAGFDIVFYNLRPFETRVIEVSTQVPVIPNVALGDEFITTVNITCDNDNNANNNSAQNTQQIVGSYDPNDITESRGREIEINTFNDADYLYYTIRFQNTGTAPAYTVRVENLLGSQFDYSTLQMLHASHIYTLDREDNHLSWKFNNILLTAEEDNEPASHGYIYFRVKPLPGYQVGDIIPNSADIYFDFNPAIVTNTFETEFVDAALSIKEVTDNSFKLYPNPAKTLVNITASTNVGIIATVKIYDLTGKTIYTSKANAASLAIDSSAFASGNYFVEVVSSANAKTVKKLLIE